MRYSPAVGEEKRRGHVCVHVEKRGACVVCGCGCACVGVLCHIWYVRRHAAQVPCTQHAHVTRRIRNTSSPRRSHPASYHPFASTPHPHYTLSTANITPPCSCPFLPPFLPTSFFLLSVYYQHSIVIARPGLVCAGHHGDTRMERCGMCGMCGVCGMRTYNNDSNFISDDHAEFPT